MTFKVIVEASDIEFPCEPGETVLDAAERAGYSLPYSCRKGVCSTCEGDLLRGDVAIGASDRAGPSGHLLFCQARPRSDILIHPRRIQRRDRDARKTVTAKVVDPLTVTVTRVCDAEGAENWKTAPPLKSTLKSRPRTNRAKTLMSRIAPEIMYHRRLWPTKS